MEGIFGDLFDYNDDGMLDTFEKATDFTAFTSIIDSAENAEKIDELELMDEEQNI